MILHKIARMLHVSYLTLWGCSSLSLVSYGIASSFAPCVPRPLHGYIGYLERRVPLHTDGHSL